MKFEGSAFEERYSQYWNNHVVSLDKHIRSAPEKSDVSELIKSYRQHVRNILLNMNRQSHLFEDQEYFQKYGKSTVTQAIGDFYSYAERFPKCEGIISLVLREFDARLPKEGAENRMGCKR